MKAHLTLFSIIVSLIVTGFNQENPNPELEPNNNTGMALRAHLYHVLMDDWEMNRELGLFRSARHTPLDVRLVISLYSITALVLSTFSSFSVVPTISQNTRSETLEFAQEMNVVGYIVNNLF